MAPWSVPLTDFGTATHARAVIVLLVFCCLAFLPGILRIPPIDRDEARFAQATKQMVETGDYVDIRYQDEVRYKKPVGIYWLQAASVKIGSALGVRDAQLKIWLYRIPSFIGATGGVLLTYWAALAFVSRRAAMLAGIMMASCILLGVEARLAKTDAMLFLTVVAAMGAMARIYLGEGQGVRRTWMLPGIFWTAIAAGVLIKGPLILMVAGLTAAALIVVRPQRALAAGAAARARILVAHSSRAAMVRRHRVQIRQRVFFRIRRPGHAQQGRERAGIARRVAGILSSSVLRHVLAGVDLLRAGRARDLSRLETARDAVSARLARSVMDRVRTRRDQAAALCAAALSRDRDPDRRTYRAE